MKDKQLLSMMFSDADQFREQLLHQTLGHVRRKRRMRRCGQGLVALAIIAAAFWFSLPRRAAVDSPRAVAASVQVVHTRPLSLAHIVTTRNDSVTIITSDKSTFALLEDEQLLNVVPGETKLLVWHAPHEAELVIVGP